MTDDEHYTYADNKNDSIAKNKIPWKRLTKEEQEEIINNAKKRKEELNKKNAIKNYEISTGKQKTIDNSWK